MTKEIESANGHPQAVESEEKKGPVDQAMDKARELGLINKANEMVEKAKNKLSVNR